MARPPIKKPITAIREAGCRSLKPEMAWPEVQPPAYRVPNPTKKPPKMMNIKPLRVNNDSKLNMDIGTMSAPGFSMP